MTLILYYSISALILKTFQRHEIFDQFSFWDWDIMEECWFSKPFRCWFDYVSGCYPAERLSGCPVFSCQIDPPDFIIEDLMKSWSRSLWLASCGRGPGPQQLRSPPIFNTFFLFFHILMVRVTPKPPWMPVVKKLNLSLISLKTDWHGSDT